MTSDPAPAVRTLPQLLRHLGVDHAPVSRQQVVLALWLRKHQPGPQLSVSIRVNGYGFLLDPVPHRRGPIRAPAPHHHRPTDLTQPAMTP